MRTRYRLGVPVREPTDVHLARGFRHPIDVSHRSLLAATYRALHPHAVDAELAEAQRLAGHRVTLLGHTMDHGNRIAWSRDPVSGQDWGRGFSGDIPYRGEKRLGDIKLPWELNKHQYFFTLGKASWLTGDSATAAEVVRQIDDWIDDNPSYRGINWISALETGTRVISWIMAFPFYADNCDAAFRQRLVTSVAQHLLFVEQHLSTGPFANTHLVGEAAALVAGGLFLDCPSSARWLATGLEILEAEIGRQVSTDGMHAEQSVAYHRFFLDQYYLVTALLAANGRSLTAATLERMERMTSVLMHMLFPDGTAPAFGDGDDARGLWLRADCPADYRALLALGAVLFERGDFKAAASGPAEEVLWLLGLDGVTAFDRLAARPPAETSVAYPGAGYYLMRSGWARRDSLLAFDCGPLGFGAAGHGHADALSFQLQAAGYSFFVDSGTFSYNRDYQWRDAFRGTRAHNTIVVDGCDQSIPEGRMSWKSAARSRSHEWVTTPWFDLVDGEHDGYARLSDPVTHRRIAFFVKPDVWIIGDVLSARQHHDLELLLHVRPDCTVEVDPGGEHVLLTSPHGQQLNAWITGGSPTANFEIVEGTDRERGAWFSPEYGRRLSTRALRVKQTFTGRCSLLTGLSTARRTRPVVTHQEGTIECLVTGDDGSETRLSYVVDGTRTRRADNIRFDGSLLFQRRLTGRPPVVWAGRFRELSIEGLLEVRASAMVDSLVLDEGHCRISLDVGHTSGLDVEAADGIRLEVNGQPHPARAGRVQPPVGKR